MDGMSFGQHGQDCSPLLPFVVGVSDQMLGASQTCQGQTGSNGRQMVGLPQQ